MNILILNWRDPQHPKSGGAEVVTMEHAKAWVAAGSTVTWFTSHFAKAPVQETIDGVRMIRRGNSLSVFLFAPFFYRQNGPYDVVIDQIHGIPFFTPLYVRDPIIAFIHEVAQEIWDYMFPFPINKIGKYIEPIYLRLYRRIHFWTDAPSTVKELVRFGIPERQCVAIACPITNPVRKALPRKADQPVFLFVSRVVKMKGIEEVIKAFAFIYRVDPEATLWVIGQGDSHYISSLHTMTHEYGIEGAVTFFGKVTQEEKLYRMSKAHILLHASVKEGWGLVVIEAASQATPAIVYNVTGLRDTVVQRQTGIIVKTNSPREVAREALLLLRNHKRYRTYQRNCLHWADSFQWQYATNTSFNLLKSVI